MKETHYLLLLEGYGCRDCDEWLGIYHDDGALKTAYEEAVEYNPSPSPLEVAIYEFIPVEGKPQITTSFKGHILHGQRFRPVKPEDLDCFQKEGTA